MSKTKNHTHERSPKQKIKTRDRLIQSATALFAEKGYDGTSIREICEYADTSINMVHHYFKSKEGLYETLKDMFSTDVFLVPLRIIDTEVETKEQFVSRFELFVQETLEALISHEQLFNMLSKEKSSLKVFAQYRQQFTKFIEEAKKKNIVRNSLDTEMLTGIVMDRLGNQVIYASVIEKNLGFSIITDKKYRKKWIQANIDFFLHGTLE